ncbi:hypothetical protein M378DRAFT_11603 [Amanita muscaria Koide BX008]|uniref:Uncharacterized protein n=1 Tax=Amanita muscaria (strain Koide BX008) TaxID=946122 RepID=A0A0C2X4M4_AMAMK|nr:hypothetical protein M378DRAFT_11603 [Amanita muscaria Koide BX008]
MGVPSSLRFVPASQSAIPIDWTRVPKGAKEYLIEYHWHCGYGSLPATIGDLAKMFDGFKFFGYFEHNLIVALMDISEFGLQPISTPGQSVGPRFYMEYGGQLWFLLFEPGTREYVVGYGDIINKFDNHDDEETYQYRDMTEDEEMAQVAEETAMTQAFDVALEQEFPRGMDEWAEFTKKLGGQWTTLLRQMKYTYAAYQ